MWDSAADAGWEGIGAKFMRVAGPIVGLERADRIVESIRSMDIKSSPKLLVQLPV